MAIKSILTNQEDFTGEFPVTSRTSALWRFNEKTPDENLQLIDSSDMADILPSPAGQGHRQTLLLEDSEDTSGKILLIRLLKRPIL